MHVLQDFEDITVGYTLEQKKVNKDDENVSDPSVLLDNEITSNAILNTKEIEEISALHYKLFMTLTSNNWFKKLVYLSE